MTFTFCTENQRTHKHLFNGIPIFKWIAGKVYVEWDTGIRCQYSHGKGGIYNIVACDEPRIPEDGFPVVGCFVKRGKWLKSFTECAKN